MNNLTASESNFFIRRPALQAELKTPVSSNLLLFPDRNNNIYKLSYTRQRSICDLATIQHELMSKNLLVLGSINIPFHNLIAEFNVSIRRIYLTEYLAVDFMVEEYYVDGDAEGYEMYTTSFSKKAFGGSWDFVIAHQSPTTATIGRTALEILQQSTAPIRVKEVILLIK